MKIGIISDLHLEGSNMEIRNPGWDCLVIAGDLSAELDNIPRFFSSYELDNLPIVYVLGNHEFENKDIDTTVDKIKELVLPFENVHVLHNESVVINNTKFIGTTLWSNFELEGQEFKKEAMAWSEKNVVDFRKIFKKSSDNKYYPLTAEDMLLLNQEAIRFLNFELKNNPFSGDKIVVSHFAPHPNSIHERLKGQMSAYWVNNLENLLGFSDYWIHGHTHNNFNYEVEGTTVLCNPRGYSKTYNLASNNLFDPKFTIELAPEIAKKIKP